jgi:hypothetical protein
MPDEPNSNQILDLTTDVKENEQGIAKKTKFKEEPYDPRQQEDSARRRIAYILLSILGVIVLWALGIASFFPDSIESVLKMLQIILGPVIALVSAATGFYFGSKK